MLPGTHKWSKSTNYNLGVCDLPIGQRIRRCFLDLSMSVKALAPLFKGSLLLCSESDTGIRQLTIVTTYICLDPHAIPYSSLLDCQGGSTPPRGSSKRHAASRPCQNISDLDEHRGSEHPDPIEMARHRRAHPPANEQRLQEAMVRKDSQQRP